MLPTAEPGSFNLHMVRDVDFFREAKDVEVRTRTRALNIDRQDKKVLLHDKDKEKWKNVQTETLEANMDQVPRAETVVLVYNNGGRSYEAQLKLARRGITNTLNAHGGMAMLKKRGGYIKYT